MKIAICFSGSIRDFPTCLPSLRKFVLNNLNADIFLHLWKMDDATTMATNVNFKWRNDDCDEDYVLKQLNPVSYVIDKYSNEWENKIINESRVNLTKVFDPKTKNYGVNACGMYYKIFKCFELVKQYSIEKNITYDIVIRARLDFIWEDNITPNDFCDAHDNKIFLIRDRHATHTRLVTNDKFFAGNFNAMEKMCNIFNCIYEYQCKGIMIEGQTLNETHIKRSKFEVKWIGHRDTYYKCMGRHRLKINKRYIQIENDGIIDNFLYELSYYLLSRSYNIIYVNEPNIASYKLDVLKSFPSFEISEKISNKTNTFISGNYNNNITVPQIIIGTKESETQLGCKNCVSVIVGSQIYFEDLIDFIYSVIINNRYNGYYNFTQSKLIDVPINENVIYKYLDHGYYSAKILKNNGKEITLRANNETHRTTREYVKIVDLLKYFDPENPNTMPINLNPRKSEKF